MSSWMNLSVRSVSLMKITLLKAGAGVSGSETVRDKCWFQVHFVLLSCCVVEDGREMGDVCYKSFFSLSPTHYYEIRSRGVVIPLWAVLDHHICLEREISHLS